MAESRNSGAELEDKSCQTLKYKGVRKRKWGKWVSEIRLPNSRERIWLGSYDKPEKAARAFDAAQFCLRGHRANFNFPDTLPDIPGGHRFSAQEIQAAAAKYASEYGEDRTELRDRDSNSMAGEHDSDPRNVGAHVDSSDGAVVWPVLDMFDGGLDLDIYSGFDSIMAVNEQLYDRGILFRPVRDDMVDDAFIDGGEYFSHQSNFLWNFDNHWPRS